jgi:hypothetical protein
MKIATWSGPRNISTAMMRAWENRSDCVVSDEPLYAAWLAASDADHPGRERIIAAGQSDWRRVVAELIGPNPQGSPLWYQKHMCHHITQDMDLAWLADLDRHVFLIRQPDQVVASYIRARGTEDISAEDVGLPRQLELFEWISKHQGYRPPVIDSSEFLAAPEAHLRALCQHLEIAFDPAMLSWPAGPRESDGIWAPYWYDSVWRSTGFEPAVSKPIRLAGQAARVAGQCQELYQALYAHRLPCRD